MIRSQSPGFPGRMQPVPGGILALTGLFCYFLLCIRVIITGRVEFVFLLWNGWLAFVPFAMTRWVARYSFIRNQHWLFAAFVMAWLLFIPNSFYLLTDLFHLGQFRTMTPWFDLLLIFSFAWAGLLLGIQSVHTMMQILRRRVKRRMFFYPEALAMWLIALGVYIGRYLRYNTWDVVVRPADVITDLAGMALHPFRHLDEWAMITAYSMFLSLAYFSLHKNRDIYPIHSFKP